MSSAMLRCTANTSRPLSLISRSTLRSSSRATPAAPCATVRQQCAASSHAISNPTLANIEKRWESMPPQEQANLWMALRDRMKSNWNELTLQERKAAYWIAFGPHGPRAMPPPGEGWKVFWYTMAGLGVSFAFFVAIKAVAGGDPPTMTKEWQEATNEYLKGQNTEPITGVSSEGYKGPGMVQSKSGKKD
ncbi:MAG: Cytochrome c oxidase subunit 5A [Stictis urceolatum]|nr:Cytochrome c oxidase subunit 5A [Stictis urceolata]